MSYNCCSGNFSSRSLGGYLQHPGISCGSSYPSNLVYSTDLCSPSTCQLGSSLYSGCQETCCEPTRYQTSFVVSSPCQRSCCRPRTSTFCSPCQTYSGSLGFGSSGFHSVGCGPSAFSSLSYRPSFYHPTYFSSRSCQSAFQPACGFGFY
ncbi:keratin-associated protein 13-1-like [Equus asinus]|uniref:Keratin-associated protein n=2 Tax=Equus asinus TaxID=9793 RepID=A0A9L0K1H1_EQUAS|nr:keratin-associated protein 13-1-like [Equus asinus]